MNMLKILISWFLSIFKRSGKPLKTITVDDIPENYKKGVIYIIGEEAPWYAALMCPCGCDDVIRLCLQDEVSPSWKLIYHSNDGTVSLSPSVWRTKGCKSHFFLKRGYIDWCG